MDYLILYYSGMYHVGLPTLPAVHVVPLGGFSALFFQIMVKVIMIPTGKLIEF